MRAGTAIPGSPLTSVAAAKRRTSGEEMEEDSDTSSQEEQENIAATVAVQKKQQQQEEQAEEDRERQQQIQRDRANTPQVAESTGSGAKPGEEAAETGVNQGAGSTQSARASGEE